MIKKIIIKNLFFYWQKAVITVMLVSFLFFLGFASYLFTNKIKKLADAPLNSLQTEIILQQDKVDKNAEEIKTVGVIEPFNLESFSKTDSIKKLKSVKEIKEISIALILWQFDLQNNRTIVGLDVNDPTVGLRRIEKWLTAKSRFFSGNNSPEVILERHFAKLFGYKLNGQYKINDKNYKIVGIVDFKEQSNLSNAQVFMPYNTALALIKKDYPIVNQVYISLSSASLLAEAQNKIKDIFLNFSIITKDRLLKNLSSFNALIYQFGNYFSLGIAILVFLLIYWILKMNRMEFGEQTKILQIIGWPKQKIQQWIIFELSFIILFSLLASLILVVIFYGGILPHIQIEALLNQDFKL